MNEKDVLISVIVPTYGNPQFLENSICSVINQTFDNWELIIVDDNDPSTSDREKTEQLVGVFAERDNRIKYIKHEKNKNGAVARNTGFTRARGKYIALLDSDDEYLPERLARCFSEMEKAPANIAGVYTGCEFRKSGKVYRTIKAVPSGNFLKETLACSFMFCTGSNIFVRKSVVDELSGFDPRFIRHQDYEFLVRLFEKYSLIGLPEVLVVKNNENFNVPDVEKIIVVKKQYLDKFNGVITSLSENDQKFIYYKNNIAVAEAAMRQSKFTLANHYYREARKYGELSFQTWLRRLVFPIYNLVKS